jgi:hypothetical protein
MQVSEGGFALASSSSTLCVQFALQVVAPAPAAPVEHENTTQKTQ